MPPLGRLQQFDPSREDLGCRDGGRREQTDQQRLTHVATLEVYAGTDKGSRRDGGSAAVQGGEDGLNNGRAPVGVGTLIRCAHERLQVRSEPPARTRKVVRVRRSEVPMGTLGLAARNTQGS